MADQPVNEVNEASQSAEIQARNAVKHALSDLNQAQTDQDRERALQSAHEELDRAHQQLAEARIADSDNQITH